MEARAGEAVLLPALLLVLIYPSHSLTPESPVPMAATASTAVWPPFAERLLCAGTYVSPPSPLSVSTPAPEESASLVTFVPHTKADKLRGELQGDLTHSKTYANRMGRPDSRPESES